MIPELSPRATALRDQVAAFMAERVLPAEPVVEGEIAAGGWTPSGTIESLKVEARKAGLWNLFIPDTERGAGLSVREYASLAEVMGRCWWASEVFNCSAPDTGNMDVLLAYGSKAQQDRWLAPLLDGKIRSCFGMTEPDVASSDATNIRTRITREGDCAGHLRPQMVDVRRRRSRAAPSRSSWGRPIPTRRRTSVNRWCWSRWTRLG